MRESYVAKYYSLDIIPKYRSQYIDIRLKWYAKSYELKRSLWPLDCAEILGRMRESSVIPFNYGLLYLPENYDAITSYVPGHDVYLMSINANKVRYPFKYSRDRRANFTVFHEIGHIVLGHLLVPRNAKSKGELELEEAEADEFAARLLMPEKLLFNCNYYSLDKGAQYFNVSKTALWKRLNNMKRLDLFCKYRTPSCPECGNTRFSIFGRFCPICGHAIEKDLKGMFTAYYDKTIPMDRCKRAISCPRCGSSLDHGVYDRCSLCKLYIFNFCMSYFDGGEEECAFANQGNARFCEMCGRPTYYYKMGLLRPWHEELKEMNPL